MTTGACSVLVEHVYGKVNPGLSGENGPALHPTLARAIGTHTTMKTTLGHPTHGVVSTTYHGIERGVRYSL